MVGYRVELYIGLTKMPTVCKIKNASNERQEDWK